MTILRGTTIGRGCVLGAHAVVKGDIPDYSIAVGSPAKVVKNRNWRETCGPACRNWPQPWPTSNARRLPRLDRSPVWRQSTQTIPSPSIGGPASGSGVAVGSGRFGSPPGCRVSVRASEGQEVRSEDDLDLTGRHRCLDG